MRSYVASRSLYGFLGFIAWSVIIMGVILAVLGVGIGNQIGRSGMGMAGQFGSGGAIIGLLPGALLAFAGFWFLANVQSGRASVDSAEYAQQMLAIARDQLDVSRQALKQGGIPAQSFAVLSRAAEQPSTAPTAESATSISFANQQQTPLAASADGQMIEYRGKRILTIGQDYCLDGVSFSSLELAKARIDEGYEHSAKRSQMNPA